MKKIVIVLVVICLISALAITFTSCSTYTSNSGKIEDMVGVYKLAKYECKDENDSPIDMINAENIEAYLIVGADGYGYYAYKDTNNSALIESIKIEYVQDEDDNTLYKAIKYTSGKNVSLNDKRPGAFEEPTLGFNVKEYSFNYYVPETQYSSKYVNINVHSSTVKYERVSQDATLSYVEDKWGIVAKVPKYELKALSGIYVYTQSMTAPDYGDYKYCVAEIDIENMKYHIIADYISGSYTDIEGDLSFNTSTADLENNIIGTVELGEYFIPSFNVYSGKILSTLSHEVWSEPDSIGTRTQLYSQVLSKVFVGEKTLVEYAQELLYQYNEAHK